jgi:hypothetical protein
MTTSPGSGSEEFRQQRDHDDGERPKALRLLGEIQAAEQRWGASQAGERRGTRPLFASPRDARPAPIPRLRATRDTARRTGKAFV